MTVSDPCDRVSVVRENDFWPSFDEHDDREKLVVGPDGVYVVQRKDLWTIRRPAELQDFERVFREKIPPEKLLKAGVVLKTRIPMQLLHQATTFFRAVWKRYEREDVLFVFLYYEEGRYELVHPRVFSAGEGHVDCELPEAPEFAIRFGSFHSHGAGPAFHSARDNRDDVKSPGIHIIIGHVNTPLPSLHCVVSDGVRCYPVSPWGVFRPLPAPKIPSAWFPVET